MTRLITARARSVGRWLTAGFAAGAASYFGYVSYSWLSYGHVKPSAYPEAGDQLLDQFMPSYEVVDRHERHVVAPAETAFIAACEVDLQRSAVIRAIFRGRELLLGGKSDTRTHAVGLAAQAKEWGWGVLAELPGREIIFGAVTQPWVANPVFRALRPAEFAVFDEPGYVKIAWTLSARPIAANRSVIRTETRVSTTDAIARTKFRKYWSFLSPGIILIRRIALRLAKTDAERRAHKQ